MGTVEEAGACGTAAVISPIGLIKDLDTGKEYKLADTSAGPISTDLYNTIKAIQLGEIPDTHNWCEVLD